MGSINSTTVKVSKGVAHFSQKASKLMQYQLSVFKHLTKSIRCFLSMDRFRT